VFIADRSAGKYPATTARRLVRPRSEIGAAVVANNNGVVSRVVESGGGGISELRREG
jgi:hypothetical protein